MPNFRYRALTEGGDVVAGSIAAPNAAEVARRMEYLRLVPIEAITEERSPGVSAVRSLFMSAPRPEEVTLLTNDLALLLKAGARLDDALDLLATDIDIGRLRPTVAALRASVLAGESFGEALSRYPAIFPPIYVALVRVGEASGTLEQVLGVLANERGRAEALRRGLADAMRYPIFVFFAAGCVLTFFLLFVLPQFGTVLRDFGAKLDPIVATMLDLSQLIRTHSDAIMIALVGVLLGGWLLLRRKSFRRAAAARLAQLPFIRQIMTSYRTGLFCRNLSVLLGSGVNVTTTLRILADVMSSGGRNDVWSRTVEGVRQGGKLSDALAASEALPPMAIRMLKLGEETGQLPLLASRIADFYEAKVQRSLDRVVGIAGPAAIITISIVVGGLIVSVMTSLLSVSQVVG